jgi:predicted transcriptional regulator YdeE
VHVRTEPRRAAVTAFAGHMANLPNVRDSLRAWALTQGHETVDRPFEVWKNGIEAGFTEEGEFDVYWPLK